MQYNIIHCEERKAQEKAKRATKVGDQGGKKCGAGLLLRFGFYGRKPPRRQQKLDSGLDLGCFQQISRYFVTAGIPKRRR